MHLDFKTKSFYRAFSFGCGTERKTNQDYKAHSRLLFSVHLQATFLLYFFILETHSAVVISGYRLTRVHVPQRCKITLIPFAHVATNALFWCSGFSKSKKQYGNSLPGTVLQECQQVA